MSFRDVLNALSVPSVPSDMDIQRTLNTLDNQDCSVCSLRSSEKIDSPILLQKIASACIGLPVTPKEVINNLLSEQDEINIVNDVINADCIRLCIEIWVANGRSVYSGKQFNTPNKLR